MNKRYLTASALLASALVLTACGSSETVAAPGAGGSSSAPAAASESAEANDADIAFLTGMKPHHEQAVEMAEMVLAADPPADVAAVAQQVKDAQDPEIDQMEQMLADLGVETEAGGHDMGSMGSGMDMGGMAGHEGMMSDEMMSELDAASGTEAARLFLEGMVLHHEGAIKASDVEIADGQYAPAIELAETIKAAQADEITEMKALLEAL